MSVSSLSLFAAVLFSEASPDSTTPTSSSLRPRPAERLPAEYLAEGGPEFPAGTRKQRHLYVYVRGREKIRRAIAASLAHFVPCIPNIPATPNTSSGSSLKVSPGRNSASCGAAMLPTRPTMEHPPTALPRISVGNSSAVYTKAVEKAPEEPSFPTRTKPIWRPLPSGTKADKMQATPQTRKLYGPKKRFRRH